EYTGRLSNLQFSGAELRAILAFVKSTTIEQVNKLLAQDTETAQSIKFSLLTRIRTAIQQIESTQAPTGESFEDLALENTQIGSQD
ncbi:MAG TPA: hypothetical protein V6D22_10040, partial [Candidatus Obscuribacterales bacterium]